MTNERYEYITFMTRKVLVLCLELVFMVGLVIKVVFAM